MNFIKLKIMLLQQALNRDIQAATAAGDDVEELWRLHRVLWADSVDLDESLDRQIKACDNALYTREVLERP
jgi:hypothetical protein